MQSSIVWSQFLQPACLHSVPVPPTGANSRKHNIGIQLSCCSCCPGIPPKTTLQGVRTAATMGNQSEVPAQAPTGTGCSWCPAAKRGRAHPPELGVGQGFLYPWRGPGRGKGLCSKAATPRLTKGPESAREIAHRCAQRGQHAFYLCNDPVRIYQGISSEFSNH